MSNKKRSKTILVFLISLCLFCSHTAYAQDNVGLIFRGIAKLLATVIRVPATIIQGSATSFPFGIVTGVIGGAFQAVTGAISGGADVARGAAPYAKYAAFAL
ncbi:MAG: hypothetical protein HYZ84_06580 [Candidatus Omnitrophica bacterium]|nr:hypothetical protein [Candidatus Omnitrophota bacterium]